jgi:hypothetical protein
MHRCPEGRTGLTIYVIDISIARGLDAIGRDRSLGGDFDVNMT